MLPLPAGGAPQLFFLAAVAALIGGLSAIERKGAFQLMLSRPIVLAPILGWGMGDAQGGLAARTGVDAPLAAVGLALLLPLAFFGRRLERASEARNTQLLEEALERAAGGDPDAARVNLRGLLLPFGAAAGICAFCVLVSPRLARSAPSAIRAHPPWRRSAPRP